MRGLLMSFAKSRTRFLILLLVVAMGVLSLASPHFLNLTNLIEITQFGAILMLLALGQSMVILSGRDGIDLSCGSVLSLSGVFFGLIIQSGGSLFVAILVTLLGGIVLGAINGFLVAVIRVPALIATLGTQYVYGSLALYLTNGIPISGFPDSFKWLSLKTTLGIPNQVLFVVVPVTIVIMILIYKFRFGRRIYLLGTNPEAAKFAAINETNIRFSIFVLAGLLAAVGAVINCSWLMTARADAGSGMEMQAITVAVLGGIAVAGGSGQMTSVIVAVLIITVMNSGLQMANINSMWQLAVLGLVLIFAIVFNQLMNRLLQRMEKV